MVSLGCDKNLVDSEEMLAILAALIFIAGVVIFTIGQLNKDSEEEAETYKWMRIFAIIETLIWKLS